MTPPSLRLGGWHQTYLYVVGVLLVLSGALWLVFHYFVRIEGDFGPTLHPLEPVWLSVHGIAAAAILVGFGSVLPGHVRRAWTASHNRISGGVFFTVMLTLTITGYLLYYVGAEAVRGPMSMLHWIVGLALPLLAVWHIWRGRVSRRLSLARSRAAGPGFAVPDEPSAEKRAVGDSGGAR